MKTLLLVAGILLLIAIEILRVYFIMPFPGSQQKETLSFAYWLHNNTVWLRILGLLLIAWPVFQLLRHSKKWKKGVLIGVLALYGVIFYFFNFRFLADKMFYQPKNKTFANRETNTIPADKLVLGVTLNGQSKAYPIQLIGYHHQVRDTVGGTPVMVTYCTVCRTGRVFSPAVNNRSESFRLVGMDHFNAMFEDASTKSWWQQATGVAVAGPLKGTRLPEIPSEQMTLAAWLRQNPASLIMQPDSLFAKQYKDLDDFDKGTIESGLEKRDLASWQFKSWVVGVEHGSNSRAYDWNELVRSKIIEDSLPGLPLVIVLESDTVSFHAWNRNVNGQTLNFVQDSSGNVIRDRNTQSAWNMDGICIEGPLKGQQLLNVRASQEFWHSWQRFHPATTRKE
jgi:hypothetical protein